MCAMISSPSPSSGGAWGMEGGREGGKEGGREGEEIRGESLRNEGRICSRHDES